MIMTIIIMITSMMTMTPGVVRVGASKTGKTIQPFGKTDSSSYRLRMRNKRLF